tara:strand:- start:1382 stop:3061 length:1680 start_codon:yes stop_codon:yes gene_type:complete
MKGHKKQKCSTEQTLEFSDGSVYVGTVYDGKPSGNGQLYGRPEHYYAGYFLNGHKHGKGRQTGPNGLIYQGEWQCDKWNGHGVLQTHDFKYVGQFKNGQYHGEGVYSIGTDVKYIGHWSNGQKHGLGTLKNSYGTYVGHFYFNLKHGKGIYTESDGSVFSGSWRSGKKNGLGVYSNALESYTGNWSNNKRHGYGKWVSTFLGTYEGQWKRNVRHKKGTHVYIDGSVYTGGWSYGKRTGHGVLTYSDGSMYTGFWCDDVWNGQGCLERDGREFWGEFSEGEREGHCVEKVDGTIVSEGQWLCDLRHGCFMESGAKKLYLWGRACTFVSTKDARKAVSRMLKKKDCLSAEVVLLFYPKLIKWTLFYKHDKGGLLAHLLETDIIEKKLKKHVYKLFQQKRYTFIQRLFALCSDATKANVSRGVEVLFDKMTNEFVANPWVVQGQGYAKETKKKLLEGLHLGEFGRCPPRDPFTRKVLTESSGEYLSTVQAKSVYKQFSKSMSTEKPLIELAFEYDVQDFEVQLKNARDVGDRFTITRLMKERNEFIQRYRADSIGSDDCPNR